MGATDTTATSRCHTLTSSVTGAGRSWTPELIGFDELEEEVSKKTGFIIQNRRLDFFGVCKESQDAT